MSGSVSINALSALPTAPASTDKIVVNRPGSGPTPDTLYTLAPTLIGAPIANIAALRAATLVTLPGATCSTLGYHSMADGGEGLYAYNASDTTSADNSGTIIIDASSRRWYRMGASGGASILWFGAVSDAQMVTTNISMAIGSNLLTSTVPVFAPGDVGKSIAVTRTDGLGWCPWWTSAGGYTAVPTITQYVSATQVHLSVVGNALPPVNNALSWPYSSTPSILTWGTDNGPAINAALAAYDAVIVPDGNFAVATQILLKTRNTLSGKKNAGKLFNLGVPNGVASQDGAGSNVAPMFVNTYWRANPSWPAVYGGNAAIQAAGGDFDISITNLELEMSQAGCGYGGILGRFLFLQRGTFAKNRVTGNIINGFEGFNTQACDTVTISDNNYVNCLNGYNPWGGCTNIEFSRNVLIVPYITWSDGDNTSAVPLAIGINSVGNSGDQPTRNIRILNNTVYINGSSTAGTAVTAIYLFPDDGESPITDSRIEENTIICTGSNNVPITLIGLGCNNTVKNNIIIAADGLLGEPIKCFAQSVQQFRTGVGSIVSATSTSGSTTMTISWTGHGFLGVALNDAPFFFEASGGPTVGGVSISGLFQVLSRVDANTFTIKVPTAASSPQTVSWNGAFGTILGGPNNTTIEGNKLRDCASAANANGNLTGAVIYCEGSGNIIRGNDISFSSEAYTSGASPIPYAALVATSGNSTGRIMTVMSNTGPSGNGPLPAYYNGNSRVCYGSGVPAPVVFDPGETSGTLELGNVTAGTLSAGAVSATSYSSAGFGVGNTGTVTAASYLSTGFSVDTSGNASALSLALPNAGSVSWKDASSHTVTMTMQADNNFVFYGTHSGGSQFSIFNVTMESSVAPIFNLNVPLNICGAGLILSAGTGVPSSSTPGSAYPGSQFNRSDGSVGARIYIAQGSGSWTAIPGV